MFQKNVLPPASGWLNCFKWINSFIHRIQVDEPIQSPWIKSVHSSKISKHSITTWCKEPTDHQDLKLLVHCMKFKMNTEIIKVLAVTSNCLKLIRCDNKEAVAKLRQTVTYIVSLQCQCVQMCVTYYVYMLKNWL